MRIRANHSNAHCRRAARGGSTRSRLLQLMAAGVALSIAACGGGGTSTPPPNPLFVSAATGTDGNPGTADKPLRTIGRATQLAGDDYSIVVAPGTYSESVTTDRQGFATAQRLLFLADTSGEVFQAFQTGGHTAQNGAVVIRPPGVGIKVNNSQGTTIDGFTIMQASGGGIVVNGSNGVRVQNCIVSNTDNPNGDGIRIQSSANVVVFNNLVFDNANFGVALVSGSPDGQVISNTVAGNGVRGLTVGNSDQASPNGFVLNNILQDNGNGSFGDNIKVFTSSTASRDSLRGFKGDFNLVFPADTYDPASLTGHDDVNLDALFHSTNPMSSADFRLQCSDPPVCSMGSPALGACTASACLCSGTSATDTCLSNTFKNCLLQWTATDVPNRDRVDLDLGYHQPTSQPHCGVPKPKPTPQPTPGA